MSFDAKLFLVRRAISLRARELFICSFNSRTITYKGQFKPDQLFEYYLDLQSEQCTA
jgi:glutamate synthase domain-containing protein 1